jgi:hypothetical protein
MAEKANKQRIQIKVTDVGTNEERVSGDIVVVRGFCSYSCCSSNYPPVVDGPVFSTQTRQQ